MGTVEEFSLDIAPFTQSPRKIWVYLPASYASSHKKYPVLYMFDGHNLFFDEVATYGKCWGIREYLDKSGLDLIVVGQDCNHIGNGRMDEYCPFRPVKIKGWEDTQKKGDITAEWFVNVLKPAIEKRYRVSSARNHVGIGGSSMGGLMTDYMAARYSDVYSKFACISPATEFAYKRSLSLIRTSKINPKTRIYRSFGAEEVKSRKTEMKMISRLMDLSNAFADHGCLVHNRIIVNGGHNEATWETIVPEMIAFLFPELNA